MALVGNYFAENQRLGDWLKGEIQVPVNYSRDQVTLLASGSAVTVLTSGMVMGKVSSTGKYVQLDVSASDGSQNAAGILVHDVNVPISTDVQATIVAREATVMDSGLTWPAGISGPQIATATAQLAAAPFLIITRKGA